MSLEKKNRVLSGKLAVIAVGMFAFGFALVPFYQQICAAIGIYSLEQRAEAVNTQVDASRTVTIELDSNVHNMPWRFQPTVKYVNVHPGQLTTVEYEVTNVQATPVTGQAIASYGPQRAAEYFQKLECFCFQAQTLAPGEVRRMPVTFVVDPKLPKDLNSIALSYTFFEVAGRGG